MTYPTTCPNPDCATDLTVDGAVKTDELTPGTCYGYVEQNGTIEYDGETRLAWDAQETTRVMCAHCGHRLDTPDGLAETSVRISYRSEAFESAADHLRRLEGFCVRARWADRPWVDMQVVEVKIIELGPTESYYHVALHETDDDGMPLCDSPDREHLVNLYEHGFQIEAY